jgi:hypothetical protein
VNVAIDERAERIINHSMPRNPALPGKFVRHDPYFEVPLTFLRAGVASVKMTLIFD